MFFQDLVFCLFFVFSFFGEIEFVADWNVAIWGNMLDIVCGIGWWDVIVFVLFFGHKNVLNFFKLLLGLHILRFHKLGFNVRSFLILFKTDIGLQCKHWIFNLWTLNIIRSFRGTRLKSWSCWMIKLADHRCCLFCFLIQVFILIIRQRVIAALVVLVSSFIKSTYIKSWSEHKLVDDLKIS